MGEVRGEHDRIEQFDGLRACSFLAVFSFHAVHLPFGYLGVDLFFVLSGFLITRNLLALRERGTIASGFAVFFYRRVLRIVPPYYLALVVMLLVEPFALREAPWYFGFASNIRDSIKPVLEGPPVTLWSIAVEEQFYLLWPFLVLLVPRRYLSATFVVAIVAAALFRLGFNTNNDAVYRLMPSRMDLLAIGALLALIESRDATWLPRQARWFAWTGGLALAVFGVLVATLPDFRYNNHDAFYNVLGYLLAGIVFGALLVIVRVATTGPLRALLVHPIARHIGKVSYVAYLLHVVALDLARRLGLSGPPTVVIALAFTLAFATLSWVAFEQPLQRYRGRVRIVARDPGDPRDAAVVNPSP